MRLARKAVVKRIRTPKNLKVNPVNHVKKGEESVEIKNEKYLAMRYEFLKIAINCMFLMNGGAAVALIHADRYFYALSIYLFGAGAAQTIALAILFYFTSILNESKSMYSIIFKLFMLYFPVIFFMIGLYLGVDKSIS